MKICLLNLTKRIILGNFEKNCSKLLKIVIGVLLLCVCYMLCYCYCCIVIGVCL